MVTKPTPRFGRRAWSDPGCHRESQDGALVAVADGAVLPLASERWFETPSQSEHALLRLALGPVLDVGCGPGRHVRALADQGLLALGIDISAGAVEAARRSGAAAIRCSVFDDVPGAGCWGSALLLDGNIGIGADPMLLLRRLRNLLRDDGRLLLEAAAPGTSAAARRVTLRLGDRHGPPFWWSQVGIDQIDRLAPDAGLRVERSWRAEGRWFTWLECA